MPETGNLDMMNKMENAASGLVSLHLHEGWKFRDSSGGKWRSATVPGSVHSDLLSHGVIPDPFHGRNELGLRWIEEADWDYRCVFTVGPELLGRANIDLVFECLDTVATVVLNGTVILRSENMFQGHRVPVQGVLRRGRNTLEIRFGSAMEYIRTKRPDFHAKEYNDPVGGVLPHPQAAVPVRLGLGSTAGDLRHSPARATRGLERQPDCRGPDRSAPREGRRHSGGVSGTRVQGRPASGDGHP